MKGAPKITDFLEPESATRFEELQRLLRLAKVPFQLAPEIVRGLDYYSETVFEVQSTKLGAQGALCGGGRYDGLIQELGGPSTPSVGVGMGIERALIVLAGEDPSPGPKVFLVQATPEADALAVETVTLLRSAGIAAVRELDGRTMKAQMKTADRLGASFVLLLGEDELRDGVVSVKSMQSGEQVSLKPDSELVSYLAERL
jgi:histidyl-tRNA synthetase